MEHVVVPAPLHARIGVDASKGHVGITLGVVAYVIQ
jgi:hypothetical protein